MPKRSKEAHDFDPTRPAAPPIHRSHWGWLIIVYFFLGGISGGAQVLASLAALAGGRRAFRLSGPARYLAFVSFLPCPLLLILDLHRPRRFLNMLRVIKLRSPMSIGSWALVGFGAVTTLGAVDQATCDGLLPNQIAKLRRSWWSTMVDVAGLPLGLLLAGYTGVLLAATTVPLWARRPLLLGPLFLTSGLSTAAAATELTAAAIHQRDSVPPGLRHFKHGLALVETLLLTVWLARLGRPGRVVAEGALARWMHLGVAGLGLALPAALDAAARSDTRSATMVRTVSALATLGGGMILRAIVVLGGNASADDPEATFSMTRQPGSANRG